MKYKQNNNLKVSSHFLEEFLKERKIDDLNLFLNPTREQLYDYMLLDNIVTEAQCIIKHIDNCSNILIIVD
jgi:hypothetical protein